jgi:hypothetical protein
VGGVAGSVGVEVMTDVVVMLAIVSKGKKS